MKRSERSGLISALAVIGAMAIIWGSVVFVLLRPLLADLFLTMPKRKHTTMAALIVRV